MNSVVPSSYSESLVGQQLTLVEKKDWSWFFYFTGEINIATEEIWRLTGTDAIVLTSEDHDQWFGRPAPVDAVQEVLVLTAGRVVTGASISEITGDLLVEFENQTRLEFLQVSRGYEAWRLHTRSGDTFCLGGGDLAHVPRP